MTNDALFDRSLDDIEAMDRALNCFTHLDRAGAAQGAMRASDRASWGLSLGPLDGRTFAVKDNLAVAGQPWPAGIAGRSDIIAVDDATAIRRLTKAGAILLGRLNMEEAAVGAVTDNPVFGRTINPLLQDHTAGGSSGGSAAAVAAGFADFTLGTDTMGSVRLPAAYCGVAGLKPTFGLIGRSGLVYLAPSLDTIGPLSRDPAVLWPALKAMAGPDDDDADSLSAPKDWAVRDECSDLKGLRFGVPAQLDQIDCEPQIRVGFQRATAVLSDLGADIVTCNLKGWMPEEARRAGLLIIEAEGAVELADLMQQDGALSQGLVRLLSYGRAAPSHRLIAAAKEVRRTGAAVIRAFDHVDGLIMPTTPQRAFPHGQPAPANQAILTAPANFAGCPALTLPVALPDQILPAALQIVGPKWSEARLTQWGEIIAGMLDAQQPN